MPKLDQTMGSIESEATYPQTYKLYIFTHDGGLHRRKPCMMSLVCTWRALEIVPLLLLYYFTQDVRTNNKSWPLCQPESIPVNGAAFCF